MLIRNEKMQMVPIRAYVDELLVEGLGEGEVTEQDAQDALAELYLQNNRYQLEAFFEGNGKEAFMAVNLNKGSLWEELKRIFCSIVQEGSVFDKIIEFILEAIAAIIPFGVFIKGLVKRIIKFFLQRGIEWICPAN
ncbi:hypothetical protein [Pedobacter sp.]|uniref:hypothetical protein n=1 Tax=Pedobacter sp. TaxID=1411316 RepID=UPI0031CEB977